MTDFDEANIVRDESGKFGEKPQTAPEIALPETAGSAVWDLQLEHAELFRESEEAALNFIQHSAPEGAVGAMYEWSDQGEYLDLDHFVMADGSTISVGDVLWGDNTHDLDSDRYEEMSSASSNIEAPFDRGLTASGNNADSALYQDFTAAAASPVTFDELQEIGKRTISAQSAVEAASVRDISAMLPEGVEHVVLEQSDQGNFLSAAIARDADGNDVETDHDLWYDIDALAANIESGYRGSVEGLEHHLDSPRRDPKYIVRRTAS